MFGIEGSILLYQGKSEAFQNGFEVNPGRKKSDGEGL
jgi:hypothetical protein